MQLVMIAAIVSGCYIPSVSGQGRLIPCQSYNAAADGLETALRFAKYYSCKLDVDDVLL